MSGYRRWRVEHGHCRGDDRRQGRRGTYARGRRRKGRKEECGGRGRAVRGGRHGWRRGERAHMGWQTQSNAAVSGVEVEHSGLGGSVGNGNGDGRWSLASAWLFPPVDRRPVVGTGFGT
ncbi:hypothetical protein AG1IA_03169 [Rhizoctonia solani AG-1 IA]|uniref:Uncharacterized protein n=1 Tax=Thanatephorus cucumeris (strain AG1-IA) TaxID=983506 RepID=L8X154_THACA|nr:hypothetical protein AG1IA_03169 [Rhizoctonia solani AG-1 IA]